MKISIETECLHLLFQQKNMDIFEFIRRVHDLGADGAQINITPGHNLHPEWGVLGEASKQRLKMIRADLDTYNLYCELDTRGTEYEHLKKVITIAKQLDADVIRTYEVVKRCNGITYQNVVKHLDTVIVDLKKIAPLLEKHRIKLCLENHEYVTSKELLSVIEAVNSPWIGLLYDIGNSMMVWEEPLDAVKIMSNKIFSTHLKDNIIVEDPDTEIGYSICGTPMGEGNIDIEACYKVLLQETMLTRVCIETCTPYTSPFRRPFEGNMIQPFLTKTFAVKKAPYHEQGLLLRDYYRPHNSASKQLINQMVEDQIQGIQRSMAYMQDLRNKYQRVDI